jgi:hypothetical protein
MGEHEQLGSIFGSTDDAVKLAEELWQANAQYL